MIKGNKTVIAGKFLLKGDPAFLTSKVHDWFVCSVVQKMLRIQVELLAETKNC